MRDKHFRRRQESRARHRAIRFLKMCGLELHERQIHLYTQHRKPCSCYMCSGEKYRDNRNEDKIFCRNLLEEWQAGE